MLAHMLNLKIIVYDCVNLIIFISFLFLNFFILFWIGSNCRLVMNKCAILLCLTWNIICQEYNLGITSLSLLLCMSFCCFDSVLKLLCDFGISFPCFRQFTEYSLCLHSTFLECFVVKIGRNIRINSLCSFFPFWCFVVKIDCSNFYRNFPA